MVPERWCQCHRQIQIVIQPYIWSTGRQLRAIATQFVRGDAPALLPEFLPAQQELDLSIFP